MQIFAGTLRKVNGSFSGEMFRHLDAITTDNILLDRLRARNPEPGVVVFVFARALNSTSVCCSRNPIDGQHKRDCAAQKIL